MADKADAIVSLLRARPNLIVHPPLIRPRLRPRIEKSPQPAVLGDVPAAHAAIEMKQPARLRLHFAFSNA